MAPKTRPRKSPFAAVTVRARNSVQVPLVRLCPGRLINDASRGSDLSALKNSRSATLMSGTGQEREKLMSRPSAFMSEIA